MRRTRFDDAECPIARVTDLFGDWGSFEGTYAFQANLRQEYEQVRDNITGPQYDFTLRTHSLDAFYQHPSIDADYGTFSGGMGMKFYFGDWFALRFDVRDQVLQQEILGESTIVNNVSATFGLSMFMPFHQ